MGQSKAQPVHEVDYGGTADMHADDDGETSMAEREDTADASSGEDDDSATTASEDKVETMMTDDDNDGEDDNEDEVESKEEDDDCEEEQYPSNDIVVDGDEPCTFDLRNLLVFNAHPIDTALLYAPQNQRQSEKNRVTIPSAVAVDEKHLYQKAEAGCQQVRHLIVFRSSF